MLIYEVKHIPDLTLSKYQVFADSGIDGMLEAQLQFIKQLHKVALLGRINIHFIYEYDPKRKAGNKLSIYLVFSGNEENSSYYDKLQKVVNASNISKYFEFSKVQSVSAMERKYPCVSMLHKKHRNLEVMVNNKPQSFYVVPNWEMGDNARLYNMFQLMESFDEYCCYRVDLYVIDGLEDYIHKNIDSKLVILRNLSNDGVRLSEKSKMEKSQRSPNADEALRQYEDWIKAVDSSCIFRCRVCAFSNDADYCQLLLNSVTSESVQSGNAITTDIVTSNVSSNYSAFDFLGDAPTGLSDVPNSMKIWTTTFTAEEIAPFTRFPVLYDGENIELPKETAAVLENEGIVLGKDKNGYDVTIPQELFAKHMFVCGVPGSGKTNTMLHIANSLWNYEIEEDGEKHKLHIPFLVLEPAKKEYRELALFDIPELLIFSPSACTNFPIKINPFEFPKGLTLSEHISKLCQVFEGAFPIAPPAPFILDRAIQAVYEKHGWNAKDINTGTKPYPLMSELYDQFEKELQTTKYDSEIQGNIRSVLEMRIGSLLRREMKEIFDVPKSTLSPEEWLTKPVVIELESLGEGIANFVTLLLCTLIRETLKADPLRDKEKPIRHVIFIEEAHNLIAPEAQVKDGFDSNPKIAATAFIVKMLAEVRALREGIIIADQLPTAMAPEVIKNTNIKLVHRITSADDRELVGSTMSASPLQMENMATYTSGQALFTYEKLLRPFEMQVNLVEEHGENTPNDNELYELMMKKPAYFELRKMEEEEKYDELVEQVIELTNFQDKQLNELLDINAIDDNVSIESFEEYKSNRLLTVLKYLHSKKYVILESIKQLSDIFIPLEEIEEIQMIVKSIGNAFEKGLVSFNEAYYYKQEKRI